MPRVSAVARSILGKIGYRTRSNASAIRVEQIARVGSPDPSAIMRRTIREGAQLILRTNPDQERSPDLILLDVMMPQVDGWETLRRIQEHTGVGAIPVIMFSGKVDEESASEAATRGVQGFIGKPFDPRSLIESTKQQLPVT